MFDFLIESENAADVGAVRIVHNIAFAQNVEGAIVDALREGGALTISLVARRNGQVVGHVAFSPVAAGNAGAKLLGLGPVAVLPDVQRQRIGGQLIRAALDQVRDAGWRGVVVLGHPEYYSRFGFVPASRFDIRCEYDVPDEVFMALELTPAGLTDCAGLVRYHAAFALAAT